ncbi:MAG: family 20 glycosylhydrolase [bacterium]|nr:family 20 glycosylhydrolase [bacterium]
MMRILICTCVVLAISLSNAQGGGINKAVRGLHIVPAPKSVNLSKGYLLLGARVVAAQPELRPLAIILADEVSVLTGKKMTVVAGSAKASDILLKIDKTLKGEAYALDVGKMASVRGGNYTAVAMGTVSLLQAISVQKGVVKAPRMTVKDEPSAAYRGLLVDLAREWHKMKTVKQIVVMCRWYKIRHLQLHLTDDQSCVFPSKAYPKAGTPNRHYTLKELHELETFARDRGVTIVPELEAPGHSGALRAAIPQLKCTTGGPAMCPGNKSTYEVLDKLIGEMCAVFQTTPYFHIGCDEVIMRGWSKCTNCKAYMQKHKLENPEELYRHFIVRMNKVVKKYGKRTIVWEGFRRGGKVVIPRDILVMAFEGGKYYRPDLLVKDGYTVINTSWQPLYVVLSRTAPIGQWPVEYIYGWNMFRFEHFCKWAPAFDPIQLTSTAPVIGAMMCSWENPEAREIAGLRKRLAAMSERIWNPDAKREFKDFAARLSVTDTALTKLLKGGEAQLRGKIVKPTLE